MTDGGWEELDLGERSCSAGWLHGKLEATLGYPLASSHQKEKQYWKLPTVPEVGGVRTARTTQRPSATCSKKCAT